MRIYVDPDLCIGCGPCVNTCPEVFDLNDDGVAFTKVDEISEEYFESWRETADSCPNDEIFIEE